MSALALVLAVTGCAAGHARRQPAGADHVTDLGRVRLTAAELDRLAQADGSFAGALFRDESGHQPGNLVLSPASVAVALQMAYAGARGSTASEMATALHVQGVDPLQVAAAAAQFLRDLSPLATDKKELLTLVNQVWVQQGFPLTPSFDTAMRTGFGADTRRVDFAKAEAARQAINAAVAAQTHDKIQDLLPEGSLDSSVRLVLTNAVYLHAGWLHPFQPDLTEQRQFRLDDGSSVQAKTMEQSDTFDYVHHDGYQAVRLPYAGGRLAMTILLPDAQSSPGQDLQKLTDRVAGEGLDAVTSGMKPTMLTLDLPSFRFTWQAELSDALKRLGMTTAFGDGADFSGISTAESLQIASVQHEAFVAVDEKGTEAAAATAVTIVGSASRVLAPKAITMRVDHPFLFAITDTTTGLPLFLGRVLDPTLGG